MLWNKDEMSNKEIVNEKSISLDCGWEVYSNSTGDITDISKSCTMQIGYVNSFNQLKCVLFQEFYFSTLPKEFLELLKITNLKIFGVSVGGDIARIGWDFRCNDVTKNLKHVTNLGVYARRRNIIANGTVKLKNSRNCFAGIFE